MINVETICKKLENILNGIDPEITVISPANENFFFKVYSEGLYLSNLSDQVRKKNFCPVFVGQAGGTHNPVPELKDTSENIQIAFYFPVRFKNIFYALEDFLENVFVGQVLTFGEQKVACNMSIAQFGEIQNLDMQSFRDWIEREWKEIPIESMEPYWSVSFVLFVKTGKLMGKENGVMIGNDAKITKLKVTYKGSTILEDTSPISIERAVIANSEPATQQLFGETHASGFPANLGYTNQLPIIIKNTSGYRDLIKVCEVDKDIQNLMIELTRTLPFKTPLSYTHKYFVSGYTDKIAFGDYIGISLTLSDLQED